MQLTRDRVGSGSIVITGVKVLEIRVYDFNIDEKYVARGGNSPNSTSSSNMTIDQAYYPTQKGSVKKMYRKMFAEIRDRVNSTVLEIKSYMAKKQSSSSSDF